MAKICSKCHQAGDFFICRRAKDGLQSQCKRCKSKAICQYYKGAGKQKKRYRYRADALKRYYKNRVSYNVSRMIRRSLGRDKGGVSWERVVGYTLEQLKYHLECRFEEGMTWDNYGKWHIDHIRPISSFNITSVDCDDFVKCWSLDNLQPLWAKDNIMKSNKW